ncbi:MAG: PAS domain-containing protein, partial [Ilumatobacteraceae bacterium]
AEFRALVEQRADVLDDLLRALARLTAFPIALVTTVGTDAIRLLARYGVEVDEVDLAPGLCASAVQADGVFVIPDATRDPVAATNPLVTGPLGVRFYAAAPLVAPDGERLGNLCLMGREPRELPAEHHDVLVTFARLVMDELELQRGAARIGELEGELAMAKEDRRNALRRSEHLADAMPIMVWTARPDGVLEAANAAYYAYIGVEPGGVDLAAGEWIEGIHPDDRSRVAEAWADAVDRGKAYELEFRVRRHDGAYRWNAVTAFPVNDEGGAITSWFGAATDVHDRLTAEAALAERERELRVILDNAPECVKVVSADGGLLEMNPAGLALIDAGSLDEVRGCAVDGLVHPDDRSAFVDLHGRATHGEEGTATFRLVGLEENTRWVESHSVPLAEEPDGRYSVLSVTRDVTERRRDDVIRLAEARILEQLVSGAALGGVLHEIVTALDAVNGGASSLLLVENDRLRHGAALHLPSDHLDEIDGVRIGPDVGTCGAAAALGEPVVSTDLATDPHWEGFRDRIVAAGFVACASTPVIDSTGRVVAVLAQYLVEQREPDVHERAATDRMARLASLAIERIRTDMSLRQTTSLLRVASSLGHLGGWSVDVPSGEVTWSDEVAAIHDRPAGYRPKISEAISYYVPEHRDRIAEAFSACVERGEPYDLEAEIITAEGRRRWCRTVGQAERDAGGRIVRVAGAFQDITAYKESERALRENEERFRLLARATSDVVFDWDLASDTVWYGEGLEELVGPVPDRLLSISGVARRVHPDDVERVTDGLRGAMDGSDELWSDEFRLLRDDGTPLSVEASGFVLRDASGEATRLVGSLVDTTARHMLEDQLAQAQRLEAVGQLTGGVAHDFNNLLTVILGNVDLLADDLAAETPVEPDDLRSSIDMVRSAAERGAELTGRLLAFARRQPLAPEAIDVAALLDGITGLLGRTLGEDIDLQVRHADQPWSAMVDAAQLESAVLNVCLNARDAMPGGGRLAIETSNVELDELYVTAHPGLEPGQYLMIAISDDGVGMAPEVVQRVFEPFFTTKAPGRGSGLGLSMVYGFAKQSSGHARIYSEPGHGTTVRLYLPRAGSAGVYESAVAPLRARRGGTERVLLVEDDELVREVIAVQLRGLGYQVVEAGDGPTALALLRDGEPFALLFTDIVMPGGMNGPQLAEVGRRLVPDLAVLFTSGYTEGTIEHKGRLDPGVELLTKPYRLDELAERVRRVIDAR